MRRHALRIQSRAVQADFHWQSFRCTARQCFARFCRERRPSDVRRERVTAAPGLIKAVLSSISRESQGPCSLAACRRHLERLPGQRLAVSRCLLQDSDNLATHCPNNVVELLTTVCAGASMTRRSEFDTLPCTFWLAWQSGVTNDALMQLVLAVGTLTWPCVMQPGLCWQG